METSDYYALGIPVFLVLIGAELALARRRGRSVYRLDDTLANLGCGLGQLVVGIFGGPIVLLLYRGFHHRFALVEWGEGSWLPWALAFVGVDLCYYWFHRLGHEVNALWAVHVVHHQSEEYNLSVALRQTWFSDATALLFYWPLPLLGVPEVPFFVAVAFLSLYQVSLHTRLAGKPGAYGWLFNTPSHHRVHHARNPRYRDRNFGATLIVWDRLFGTFEAETEAPVYGAVRPLASSNPVSAQVRTLLELVALSRAAVRPLDKARVWLAPPGWVPPGAEGALGPPAPAPAGSAVSRYVLAQAIVTGGAAWALLVFGEGRPALEVAPWAALILFSLFCFGALLDGRSWARPLEAGRVALVLGAAALSFG